jgi:hypothetical protein
MTLISSGVSKRPANRRDGLSSHRHSWWTPRWLQRRREADELARWASEVMWQWNDTMDNTTLAHHTLTASRLPIMVAPQVESVEPGPPVTLLVRMLPGRSSMTLKPKRTALRQVWTYPRYESPRAATDLSK